MELQQVTSPAIRERIEDLITRFLMNQDVRPSSKKTYQLAIKQYFAWINRTGNDLSKVTREQILSYKQDLLESGLSSLTVGSYITVVRKFYEWAEANRYYPNVAKGVKSPKRKQAFRKNPLTSSQATELLNYFEESPRDFAIVNLLLRTGLRTIEVIRADIGDLGIRQGQRILKIQGKGSDDKDSFVVLTEKCNKAITGYLSIRGRKKASDPLFTSHANRNKGQRLTTHTVSVLVKKGLRAIGLDDPSLTAHSLRHTCAVSILRAGGSLADCKNVLRHSNTATTEIYIETFNEERRLQTPPEQLIDGEY